VRARVAALFTALLTAAGMLAVSAPGPASAQAPFPGSAAFSGYSTGTAVHADVIQVPDTPRLVDGEVATSSEAADTAGLGTAINNEMAEMVSPSLGSKNAYGRGTGLEVGLGTDLPDNPTANQLILAGLAQQAAAPIDNFGDEAADDGTVTKEVGPIPGDPLVYASALKSQAAARWNPNFCPIGVPIGFGLGQAADAQLINAGSTPLPDPGSQPIVATDVGPNNEPAVVSARSFTYLRPQGDGTFAVVSETHEELAPVTLFKGMEGAELRIDVGGEWILRTVSTGKPGGSFVEYAPAGEATPTTPLVTITPPGGQAQIILKTQDLFGPDAIPTQIPLGSGGQYLGIINVGENPRAIGSDDVENPPGPEKSADGTTTGAAVDVVRLQVVVPATGQHIAEVRIGHMEAKSVAPVGGVECPIPVSKTANPDPVNAGQDFTWTVTVPSVPISDVLGCELTNLKATDTASVIDGTPSATITGASNGGVVGSANVSKGSNGTVTWDNLGTYKPGDPPITFTISGHIAANSGAGVLQNVVNVTATLGNCTGGAAGDQLVGEGVAIEGTAALVGAAVKGTATVAGPKVGGPAVAPARLAETGEQPWIPAVGGGLLLGAMALWRGRRKLHPLKVKQ
jgi:hypothetical protein